MKLCLLEEMELKGFNLILKKMPLRWGYRLFKHHMLKYISEKMTSLSPACVFTFDANSFHVMIYLGGHNCSVGLYVFSWNQLGAANCTFATS